MEKLYWMAQIMLRGGIPFVIMFAISRLLRHKQNFKKAKDVLTVGLIWLFVGMASLIYEIPNWSITRMIIVHFIVMLLTVYPCLLFSGWFRFTNVRDAFKILMIFLAIGAVIVLGFGVYYYFQ